MERVKLSDICNPKQWRTIPTSELLEEGYPVYGANGIIGFYGEYNHENPAVAVTCRGATCGSINITVPKAYITGNAMCLDDLRSDIDIDYLYYCLKHYDFKKVISGSAQPQITRQGMDKIYIMIGTTEEQKAVVKRLNRLESITELRKQELKSLDELIKSRFVEMFGDPVSDSKQWGQKPLKEMIESIRYGTSTPPQFSETGYAFIRATNIKNGQIIQKDMKYIPQVEAEKLAKCKLLGGEILIVRSGVNAGDTCVVTDDFVGQYAGYDMILVLNKEINPVFFNELVNTTYMDKIVKPLTRRAAQPHLNSDQVQSFPIIRVPIELQNQFATFVAEIDKYKF